MYLDWFVSSCCSNFLFEIDFDTLAVERTYFAKIHKLCDIHIDCNFSVKLILPRCLEHCYLGEICQEKMGESMSVGMSPVKYFVISSYINTLKDI